MGSEFPAKCCIINKSGRHDEHKWTDLNRYRMNSVKNHSMYLTGGTTQGRHWPAYSHLCRRSAGRTASGSTKRSQGRETCERNDRAANPAELQAQPEIQPPTAAYPWDDYNESETVFTNMTRFLLFLKKRAHPQVSIIFFLDMAGDLHIWLSIFFFCQIH